MYFLVFLRVFNSIDMLWWRKSWYMETEWVLIVLGTSSKECRNRLIRLHGTLKLLTHKTREAVTSHFKEVLGFHLQEVEGVPILLMGSCTWVVTIIKVLRSCRQTNEWQVFGHSRFSIHLLGCRCIERKISRLLNMIKNEGWRLKKRVAMIESSSLIVLKVECLVLVAK